MRARRRSAKGALASITGAFLLTVIVIMSGTFAAADAPWPQHPPGQDPYRYEDYCFSPQTPDDYDPAGRDFWKYSGDESNTLYQALIGLFNPDLNRQELEGVMGASVDKAWSITTGRPDVLIAVLDSGIAWHDAAATGELARKCHLNEGELPPPEGAADTWDKNGDGVFNVDDYIGDPRVADLNGNGLIDPQDLIWTFSDGEDGDGNGYADDICGWDFHEDDNDPWDELGDGHGTAGGIWSAGEANSGSIIPGTCPNAMILPVRVGDSCFVDAGDFAQGVVFAVDSGAWLVQGAVNGVNNTNFAQEAIDYAYSSGVAVVAAAGDQSSARRVFPAGCENTIQVNAVQRYNEAGSDSMDQFPPSYLYLAGNTDYGAHTVVSAPDGHSSGAAGRLAGVAALIYSAAENDVQRGEMWRYPGLDTPLSANEVKQIITMTADDIDFSPGSCNVSLGIADFLLGSSQRFPSTSGWDPYFGYGRVNAYEAVAAVDQGRIPPEAEISSPHWFELVNPGRVSLDITGKVAAVRAGSYKYVVEWGPGWDPGEGEWITASEADYQYEPVEGVLATLDLGQVYRAVMDSVQERGGADDPNRYTFTVRIRVRDDAGNWGEDRKAAFCFDDPDAYAGMPLNVGSGISASPRFADLDDDGENELIVATDEGMVHAYDSDLGEVAGWPVHVTPLPLHDGSEGYKSGRVTMEAYASVAGTPAVGDLDHDGTLEVVAADMQGRVYAWDREGELLPGYPLRSNPLYSIPDRADWWTEGVLPAAWQAERFVPDKVHRLDRWNRLDKAFMQGPVLCNLDGSADGSLEIVAACMDQHLYAWHADGRLVEGWPVKLVDPARVASFDPLTHTCDLHDKENQPGGGGIAAAPSVADLDGDGDLEVICGTGELYADEAPNVSSGTFGAGAFLSVLEALSGRPAGEALRPGNTRVYALHHAGAAQGLEAGVQSPSDKVPSQAYLDGWPASIAVAVPGMMPGVTEGLSAAPLADVDGDGSMEIGISPAAGPAYLLNADGSSFLGSDESGLPLGLESNETGGAAASSDVPLMCVAGGACFADLGGGLSYIAPTVGLGRLADKLLPASQAHRGGQLSAWSASDGGQLDSFPARLNDAAFFMAPAAADIDGDGLQEVLAGSSYYDFHAFNGSGEEPWGWPKFTGGWTASTPAVGDFGGDGAREVATGTREGWLFVWKTDSSPADTADWPSCGHDLWGTGCLETDAVRPGRVGDLAAEELMQGEDTAGVKLTWTAPGDDGYRGTALVYEIRFSLNPIDGGNWKDAIPLERGKPLPGEAGTLQEYACEGFPFAGASAGTTFYFALQTRDEVGNLSAVSNPASASHEDKTAR